MEGHLAVGKTLKSNNGSTFTVKKLLGAGGQGEVYEVAEGNKRLALKWYYSHTATEQQKNILDKLVEKGSPAGVFLWPEDLVVSEEDSCFGYIMPLRPKEFKSIVDLMKRRAEPGFESLLRAAFNLVKGYRELHTAGYQYRDISFGNVFFNPDNGDVLICDNDNVVPNGETDGSVLGTPRFMAPEIVLGEARPSRNTDKFSLAVLLFYMLFLGHPLEGKQEYQIKCMDIHAMNRLYGEKPVFIFDPDNDSNRPVPGYQDNPITYWNTVYPEYIKRLFTQAFTVGLKEPGKRVTEKEWLDAFAGLLSGIVICPNCGAETFYDPDREAAGEQCTCWGCGKKVPVPSKLVLGKQKVLITSDTRMYSHHIRGDYDMDTVVGEVAMNPKNPSIWGLRNKTSENWTYIKADGTQTPVMPGKAATIAADVKLDFGSVVGFFE